MRIEDGCEQPKIFTSCYYKKSVNGENMIFRHAFAYQISGSLLVRDGQETVVFHPGDFRLNIRNKLAKFVKQPGLDAPFQSLSISFDEELLREFAKEHQYAATKKLNASPSIQLKKSRLYTGFIESLQPYLPLLEQANPELVDHKIKEALLVLLTVQPELKDILFDFARPEKLNLEAFMNQHYRFNISLDQFAYLTGRSLSAFKRDFKHLFNDTPTHWLIQKRLAEAHYRIAQGNERPTAIYIELGFEDLSHFSFAFKKKYGYSPAILQKEASRS